MSVSMNINCIVCAKEFDPNLLDDEVSSEINVTNFKICKECIDKSDPLEGYKDIKKIIAWYTDKKSFKSLLKKLKK